MVWETASPNKRGRCRTSRGIRISTEVIQVSDATRLKIRIGQDVMETMHWVTGDFVSLYINKEEKTLRLKREPDGRCKLIATGDSAKTKQKEGMTMPSKVGFVVISDVLKILPDHSANVEYATGDNHIDIYPCHEIKLAENYDD